MKHVWIVEDEEQVSKRVRSAPAQMTYRGDVRVMPWHAYSEQMKERSGQSADVVVLNLTSPNAPALENALDLRAGQPRSGFVYFLEMNNSLPDAVIDAVSQPGVDFVSNSATGAELLARILRLIQAPPPVSHPRRFSRRRLPGSLNTKKRTSPTTPEPLADQISSWTQLVPELHSPKNGRLDASAISKWLGIPLKTMAKSLGKEYAAVHKTPDAPALQSDLQVFLRIASALRRLAGSTPAARIWLNAPNPDLENGETPLAAITQGDQEVIAEILEDALHGQPG